MCHITEVNGLTHIGQGNLLRRRHNDSFRIRDSLDDGQRFITRSRRAINDQIVKGRPIRIGKELTNGANFDRAAPNEGIIFTLQLSLS